MPESGLDVSLRAALRYKKSNQALFDTCPLDSRLADYVSGAISAGCEKEVIATHIAKCDKCFKKVASCFSALSAPDKNIERDLNDRNLKEVLSMPKKYPRTRPKDGYIKRNKYLFVAGGFFLLSFTFKLYFIQFLAAALIFGVKWIMDTGSTKALIMIYETWKQNRESEGDVDDHDVIKKRRM